ncbi:uncharacterized protein LOC111629618 [Centruroides sculpturatus]|uniref:uncharacterized protein LOC111629618 n=1 Tax=Centruroides sculpturatus TaxID=218467 RepID=UPI000C6E5652|nr:uncharacterized protein LOC111629618 [Centruroides sculpturatus]
MAYKANNANKQSKLSFSQRILSLNSNRHSQHNEKNFILLSINTQKCKAASSMVIKIAEEHKADIICLQEPYLVSNTIVRYGRWRVFPSKVYTDVLKTSILITNKNIPANYCNDLSNECVTTILITINNKEIYISLVYCSPYLNIDIIIDKLQRIHNHLKNHIWLITGDFNAKSPIWHSPEEDNRGYKICEYMSTNHFVSCNSSPLPTYYCDRGKSWVDIVLANNKAQCLIKSCYTIDETGSSDHRYIKTIIENTCQNYKQHNISKKTNWNYFQELFKYQWGQINNLYEIHSSEALAEHLTQSIVNAFHQATTTKKVTRTSAP